MVLPLPGGEGRGEGERKFYPTENSEKPKSGGEHAALQTLREIQRATQSAKRLDCVGFSTAFSAPSFTIAVSNPKISCEL